MKNVLVPNKLFVVEHAHHFLYVVLRETVEEGNCFKELDATGTLALHDVVVYVHKVFNHKVAQVGVLSASDTCSSDFGVPQSYLLSKHVSVFQVSNNCYFVV